MILVELKRFFWAIVFTGCLVIIAAVISGCDGRRPLAAVAMKDGQVIGCPYGLAWLAEQPMILCRTATKEGGFIVRGIALAEIADIDVRP